MPLERGKLVITKKGRPQIEIGGKPFNPAQGEISQTILDCLEEFDGKEVEFEFVSGQPKRIREVGASFIPPRSHVRGGRREGGRPRRGDGFQDRGQGRQGHSDRRADVLERQPDFHNPYNFVPAPSRKTDDPDLGDHEPVRQDEFLPDRYSGRIRVRMTAVTPLLVPDAENAREDENGHKTYPLRLDAHGKPLIPASSVRGMLRSAYEAVTNSRFGRFSYEQHKNRLAYRMEAREGLRLIPARVENGQIHLLTGTSRIGADGRPVGPMYAAWLPRYDRNGQVASWAVRYADGRLPEHGDEVVCWIELFQHHRWDRNQQRHVADFHYWKVRQVARIGETMGEAPAATTQTNKQAERSWHEPLGKHLRQVNGWVCITNANINRKHDERVFFHVATSKDGTEVPGPFPVTDEHRRKWEELIENYQTLHAKDIDKRRKRNQPPDAYLGPEPGQTGWSRHIYTPSDRELADGTLCYVRLNSEHTEVEALFPVMIARELYETSPWDLLHPSLRPPERIEELSPADRVFGWVRTGADTGSQATGERVAARGLLRIGPVHCDSSAEEAVERFDGGGLPLAILAAPKPQQGRFYVAKSPNGEAQDDGLSKPQAGYAPGKGLRGRKVYPHQRSLPEGYWDDPIEDRTQRPLGTPPHYQEYRRPRKDGEEQRDDQNRSVLGWVKPGARFSFDIHVFNLSKVELGALLWLLDLPPDHFHRFGGGKPLGFGSVRLEIVELDVRTGEELLQRYASWLDPSPPGNPKEPAVKTFKEALERAYGAGANGFERIPFIHAFLTACRGHRDNLPTHYPRATPSGEPGPPSPAGESFKWFVANERVGARYALRDLTNDPGLPTLPERPQGRGAGQPPRGGARPRDRGRSRRP